MTQGHASIGQIYTYSTQLLLSSLCILPITIVRYFQPATCLGKGTVRIP